MKILQINSCYGVYSTGKIVDDISNILRKYGHECICIFGRSGNSDMQRAFKFNSKLDIYHHTMMSRIFDKEGLYSSVATKKMIDLIKNYSPNIIHLHNIHGHYLNYKILFDFINEHNIPVVWTLHDCWTITGHCAHFDSISCKKWLNGCKNCPQKNSYPSSILMDNSANNYKLKKHLFTSVNEMVIVTPSNWLKAYIDASFMGMHKTMVIHNGIDTDIFKKTDSEFVKQFHLEDKKIVLGVASKWSKNKGFDDLIKLSKKLPQDYKIVIIGLCAKQLKNLPDNILGLEKTKNQQELVKWYSLANVFVNPTYEDTFPTVNIEAQCCGTPVVTYKTGGSPETIVEGCGIVVEQGNADELAKAIEQISANKLTEDCKNIFDKNICFSKYISLYEDILGLGR